MDKVLNLGASLYCENCFEGQNMSLLQNIESVDYFSTQFAQNMLNGKKIEQISLNHILGEI
jgi:hypothetical protein